MLKQIVERLSSITDEEIWKMFRDSPVYTVTIEEDTRLTGLGYQSSGSRVVRYKEIDTEELPTVPYKRWRP